MNEFFVKFWHLALVLFKYDVFACDVMKPASERG